VRPRVCASPCAAQLDHDTAQHELNDVYERMNAIAAHTAEARASKILHGLGFTDVMQKRATQSFRCCLPACLPVPSSAPV
jgi:ATPase subunit of ABC transporter with duplicated ATPase domains